MVSVDPVVSGARGGAWRVLVPLRVGLRGLLLSDGVDVLGGLARDPSAPHHDERLVGRAVFGTGCRW